MFEKLKKLPFLITVIIGLASALSPALILATPTHAIDVNNFYFQDFSADYYVSRNADGSSHMKVVETLKAVFPAYNQNLGIVRYIPYTNQGGNNITIPSKSALNLSITRNNKTEPIYSITKENGYFSVSTGDDTTYLHGEQTFIISYEFDKVITDFSSFQELYWDTNGTSWKQRFDNLNARVHFEYGYDDILPDHTSCYVGKHGSQNTSRCNISPIADGYSFSASELRAGENLSFAIALESGTFIIPITYNTAFIIFTIASIVVFIIILALVIKYRQLLSSKKRFYKDFFVKPEYQPIKDLSVAEAAELGIATSSRDSRVASLISLAVNHKITLIRSDEKRFGKYSWRIRIESLSGITPEQKIVLSILAGGEPLTDGTEFSLKKQIANSSLEALGRQYIKKVEASLEKKGYFEPKKPRSSASKISLTLGIITPVWFIIAFYGLTTIQDSFSGGAIPGGDTGILVVLILNFASIIVASLGVGLYSKYNRRTKKGLEIARYLEGLQLYMKMAEKDRINFLQSVKGADTSPAGIVKLYEKLLPYAIIFGMEQSWMRELERYYQMPDVQNATWYAGVAVLNSRDFHSFVSATSSNISSATHSSSSSTSSGSGGGGFSGGGGGGGGGGGR